jgi:hypothetical protein
MASKENEPVGYSKFYEDVFKYNEHLREYVVNCNSRIEGVITRDCICDNI